MPSCVRCAPYSLVAAKVKRTALRTGLIRPNMHWKHNTGGVVDGRGEIGGSETQAVELLPAARRGGFAPQLAPRLTDGVKRLRMLNNRSDRFPEQRITGMDLTIVRRAAQGERIFDRAACRIGRFLEEADRAL